MYSATSTGGVFSYIQLSEKKMWDFDGFEFNSVIYIYKAPLII